MRQTSIVRAGRHQSHAHLTPLLLCARWHRSEFPHLAFSHAERPGALQHCSNHSACVCDVRRTGTAFWHAVVGGILTGCRRGLLDRARRVSQSRNLATSLDVVVECRIALRSGHGVSFSKRPGVVSFFEDRDHRLATIGTETRIGHNRNDGILLEDKGCECLWCLYTVL